MVELLAGLLAALLGVLLDRLAAWHNQRTSADNKARLARLETTLRVQHVNAKIDKEIAGESDLNAVLDQL